MPVIKSAHTPTSISTFSMGDIEAHARALLVRASQQAEQLLAAAQSECDGLRAQAKAEGLAQGKREGLVQGKTEGAAAGKQQAFDAEKAAFTAAVATLTEMTAAFDADRHAVVAQAEAEVMPLALAIAHKVTRRLGQVDAGVVEANLRDCLRLMSGRHDVRITVNAAQHQIVADLLPRLKQQWPQLERVTIVPDATVAAGGCRVTTVGGEIAADLDTQLNRLTEELVGVATEGIVGPAVT